MLFTSPFFIFVFFPLFLSAFFFANKHHKDYVLLVGSLAFYFWGEPIFCLLALISASLDHFLCKKIYNAINKPQAKHYMLAGIALNLSILIYFKYFNFFIGSIYQLFRNDNYIPMNIILPIGVSFIVFEKITYLIDVYRGVGKPAESLSRYLNYVFLFPKLLAGPIIKYNEIEQQLIKRSYSFETTLEGFKRFTRGILKKVFVADTCAEIVNQIFALPNSELSFTYAWIGIIGFTLQIYFDFSGYSDMALGIANMLGFQLKENFNMPYIATSFTDFWRRWHISLSTWIRDYLYLPLGGNKAGKLRTYANLWICFLLSGLWHGANWTFVIWGAYNGLFLILDKLFWTNISNAIPRQIGALITLPLVMLGWVIFRSRDFQQLSTYFITLFNPSVHTTTYIDITNNVIVIMLIGTGIALINLTPRFDILKNKYQAWKWHSHAESLIFGVLGFFAICKIVGVSFNPFLYFRF